MFSPPTHPQTFLPAALALLGFVDVNGTVKAGIPRGLNFGLKAAVEQYCRKPALVVAFSRRFLRVPVHHYVDDYQSAEPSFCCGTEISGATGPAKFPASGQSMLWATYDMFGYRPLKIEKSSERCVEAAPSWGWCQTPLIFIFIKEETLSKARAIVTEALASGELTPTVAGSLYGKLRWVFCLGRIVVGALHAVKERQYANRVAGGGWPFSPALPESLQLLEDVRLPPPEARCPALPETGAPVAARVI